MKQSLLELVQDVLSDLEGDEVNSIDDTVESKEIASLARRVYYDTITDFDYKHTESIFQLDAATLARPTHMALPSNVSRVDWVKYDVSDVGDSTDYRDITYLDPAEFVAKVNSRNSGDSNTDEVTDPSGVAILIRNDKQPHHYTSFDDEAVVLDSYDSSIETNLQNSKTFCHGELIPAWSETDLFVPDLPENLWPYYRNRLITRAFSVTKEEIDPDTAQTARRQRIKSKRIRYRMTGESDQLNFGR